MNLLAKFLAGLKALVRRLGLMPQARRLAGFLLRDGSGQIAFTQGDFNRWEPVREYDAVIASQALHHVLDLEHLFDSVRAALGASGRLIVSDMIGRNGHRRWPEALAIVEEFWRELPPQYRYNRLLGRREERYDDWDHSVSGFEGIRAQDILPLMAERFRFEVLLPFPRGLREATLAERFQHRREQFRRGGADVACR